MDTNIVSALITAVATILAAFIAKGYAERRIETTPPTKSLDRPTATILHLLSKLSIKSAQVIRLRVDQVHVSDSLRLALTAEGVYPALGFARMKVTVFGQQPQTLQFALGDVLSYQSQTGSYYLICTRLSSTFGVEIQVRQADS